MRYKNFITLFILILFLLIRVGSAEVLPKDINLTKENSPWIARTFIIIPLNDINQNEVITYIHIPNHYSYNGKTIGNDVGILTSDIEFYIDNEKKNFSEFYTVEKDIDKFKVIPKKDIILNKSTELKIKYNKKVPPEIFSFDENNATLQFNVNFNLDPDELFVQYVFRVPAANAQNIKINFINSILNNPTNNITSAPVSAVYSTNKYLEISYLFWNEKLRRQVVSDEEKDSIGLSSNTDYHFQNIFTIVYDTVKWDWILQSVVVAILLTIVFYLGTLWQRRIIKRG